MYCVQCEVRGKIVGGLHVSARREQYEQLLETLRWISSDVPAEHAQHAAQQPAQHAQVSGYACHAIVSPIGFLS